MELNKFLSRQFNVTYNEKNWLAPLQSAIQGMTGSEAFWKPNKKDNSVCNIIVHLIFWNGRLLKQFKGEAVPKLDIDNDVTFESAAVKGSEDEMWQSIQKEFTALMDEFALLISKVTAEKLQSAVSAANKSTWTETLMQINLHNAYHAGQIVTLRKMAENWNAEKYGVS